MEPKLYEIESKFLPTFPEGILSIYAPGEGNPNKIEGGARRICLGLETVFGSSQGVSE